MQRKGLEKQQADELRKQSRYKDAAVLYEKLWQQPEWRNDKWLGWGYAHCLYKEQQYLKSLEVCRAVHAIDKEFSYLNNLYAWNVYYVKMKLSESNEADFLKAAGVILQLTKQDSYSPYVRTVQLVMKYFFEKEKYQEAAEWAGKLDGGLLDGRARVWINQQGKEQKLASERENYFKQYSKALLKAGDYAQCIEITRQALHSIEEFYGGADIWLKRNMALSYLALNQQEPALQLLEELVRLKKDWYIHGDLAKVYFRMGQREKAFYHGLTAALGAKELLPFSLVKLLVAAYLENGEEEAVKAQIAYYAAIKKGNGQKLESELYRLAAQVQVNVEESFDKAALEKAVVTLWLEKRNQMRQQFTGEISKLLEASQAGFITVDDGRTVYFRWKQAPGQRGWLALGRKVRFFLEESFDRKKQLNSLVAVELEPV